MCRKWYFVWKKDLSLTKYLHKICNRNYQNLQCLAKFKICLSIYEQTTPVQCNKITRLYALGMAVLDLQTLTFLPVSFPTTGVVRTNVTGRNKNTMALWSLLKPYCKKHVYMPISCIYATENKICNSFGNLIKHNSVFHNILASASYLLISAYHLE